MLVLNHLARSNGNNSPRETGRRGPGGHVGLQDGNLTEEPWIKKEQAAQRVCAALPLEPENSNGRYVRSELAELAIGHLLGHVEDELAVSFFDLAQQAAKLVEKACIFTDAAPGDVIRRLPLGEIRQLRRLFAVIKELIEWALESARQLLQRFDGRDSMTILYAGNVTTKQTGTLFDIALGEFLFFAECAKAVTDNHDGIIPCR